MAEIDREFGSDLWSMWGFESVAALEEDPAITLQGTSGAGSSGASAPTLEGGERDRATTKVDASPHGDTFTNGIAGKELSFLCCWSLRRVSPSLGESEKHDASRIHVHESCVRPPLPVMMSMFRRLLLHLWIAC